MNDKKRFGWWISFMLMDRKTFIPVLGNCFTAMPFDEVIEVDNFNLLAHAAMIHSGESPYTHTSTILNFKRMEGMDFELAPDHDAEGVILVSANTNNKQFNVEQEPREDNLVNLFPKKE